MLVQSDNMHGYIMGLTSSENGIKEVYGSHDFSKFTEDYYNETVSEMKIKFENLKKLNDHNLV